MMGGSSFGPFFEASGEFMEFEKLRGLVELEFDVEEAFLEFGTPTFNVGLKGDSKQAFLRLFKRLNALGFAPILRRREGKGLLQVVRRPPVKPGRWVVNAASFLATMGTTLLTGYILSLDWVRRGLISSPLVGALTFMVAIMAVLGAHEMAHKLAAHRHGVEASYPYFIPGPPMPYGIGTFGAVIQQKSLAPNKDALFDLGISGPVVGFIATIIVTIIGVRWSLAIPMSEVPRGAQILQMPLLFEFITVLFPPGGRGEVIWLHPVAFAGWVGMLVTMLNLMPTGMLDGGHAVRGLLGQRARSLLSFLSVMVLISLGHWPMAIVAFLLSLQQHPGPLDDVSGLTKGRKLTAVVLVLIFVLSVAPIWPLF
ncbi:MAG: Peptidase family M50 [Candidatus Bathyarchaeota archaeon BA1]|nr:MAG: Peptidase family M50 [Candidatus Bathyarchaeota archaeon BA1]